MSVQSVSRSISVSESASIGKLANLPSQLAVDDVRITPSYMHFENAYEGKMFQQKLVIQNCGKQSAFIRLCEPNAKAFEFSPFPQGIRLSSGMKVTRTVEYISRTASGIFNGFTFIWVNGKEVTYYFIVTLTETILSVTPQVIEFGKLNAVNRVSTKIFHVKNDGHKGSMFSIDLGRNALGLTCTPMGSILPAKSSVPVTVEIIGSKAGIFIEEFWVKADPPLRVVVTAVFIEPKILVRKFVNSLEFTHLQFPRTYYGGASTLPVLFRNFSSSNSMFWVSADVKGVSMSLEEAREKDDNFCNFTVKPMEGRVASLRGTIIQITFTPHKNPKRIRNYAACFLKVVRLDCKDVDSDIYKPLIITENIGDRYTSPSASSQREDNGSGSHSIVDLNMICPSVEEFNDESQFTFVYSIGVCIYGIKEMAGISFRPNLIHLSDLTIDRQYQRELLITNKSQYLPVRVKYQKLACIDVKPPEFDLAPCGSQEVLMTLRTFKLDSVTRKITFDLLARETPNDHNVFRKVGVAHLKIQFETTTVVKKSRFKQSIVCTDLADKLGLGHPFRLTETELSNKKRNDDYYLNYIRSLQKSVIQDVLEDLDSEPKLLVRLTEECPKYSHQKQVIRSFIPLSPQYLYNIKIAPRSLRLQKVAAYTIISAFFTIHNTNSFPIRVFVKALKPCVVFDRLRYIIKGKEQIKLPFSFSTTAIGKYNTNVDILINDSTLFEATIVADVIPKTLKIETTAIAFTEFDGNYKLFKFMNHLNTRATFKWDVPMGCYEIYPMAGVIEAERSMYCVVTYTPDPSQPQTIECTLSSESGQQKLITIVCKKRVPMVMLNSCSIDAGVVPLNLPIQKTLILQNLKNFQVLYSIDNDSLIPGITIEPQQGMLDGLASEVFIITILIGAVVEFSINIKILIDNQEPLLVNVSGCVEYPSISMTPEFLHSRKISPNSFDVLSFKVQNQSKCKSHISFPFDGYPEFSVTPFKADTTHHQEMVLEPNEAKLLFLHFNPTNVSTFLLYLPYVINGILGPALLRKSVTLNPKYFLKPNTELYRILPQVTTKIVPAVLPTIDIYACAMNHILTFSNLDMNFVFFGDGHYNNSTYAEFELINESEKTIEVCIRTDNLLPPFTLVPQTASNIEIYDVSYKITLEEKQKITFEATFSPLLYDEYFIKLPIFLKDYCNNKIFNHVTMRGVYDVPKIIPSCEKCDFEQIPIDFTSIIHVSLHLQNHFENCRINIKNEINSLLVTFDGREIVTREESLLHATLDFTPTKAGCLDAQIEFHCSCKAHGVIYVTGAVENCLFTTHAFSHMMSQMDLPPDSKSNSMILPNRSWYSLNRSKTVMKLVNDNAMCYPLFPEDDDFTQYGEYMRQIQQILENWLFSQGYYGEVYRKIPEGFTNLFTTDSSFEDPRTSKSGKTVIPEAPLRQLMINICGDAIKERVTIQRPKTKNPLEWLSYTYTGRSNVLKYVRSHSAYLPQVKTKYLLSYKQYIQYEKLKHPKNTPMEETYYYRLSKQCWIDLFLQIIKVFFFFPTVSLSESEEEIVRRPRTSIESTRADSRHVMETGLYGVRERQLILWLQNCYDKERETLWSHVAEEKMIVFLDEDLQDGLVLGAVTAHYCPYMRSEIKEMYAVPHSVEELHHNACLLVKIWHKLKFSFVVNPLMFEKIIMVEMLLLVTYLYSVLPNCTPRKEMTIKAQLTKKNSGEVELKNLGDDPICYEVVFLNNKSNIFSAKSSIVIAPGKKRTVKINFHAKSVNPVNATVLFSGETSGYKYAKNIVLSLCGVPDVDYVCQEISIAVDLWRPCVTTLNLQSPFNVKATYSLHMSFISNQGKRVSYSWSNLSQLRTIKELVFQESTYEFDENGRATISPIMCCEQIGPRDVWLSFTNPEVGDFGIKLTIKGTVTKRCYEIIEVVIPKNYDQLTCKCKNKKQPLQNCPKILEVMLPMKNNPLWYGRKTMLLECVTKDEIDFWNKHIFTPLGTRMMILLLDAETHAAKVHIEETVEYKVNVKDQEKLFSTLREVVVEDVTSEEFFTLPIHPLRNLLQVDKSDLVLESADGKEKRFYKFIFKNETEIIENITM